MIDNGHGIARETFDELYSYWRESKNDLEWDCLFVTPIWMKAWWDVFGGRGILKLWSVRSDHRIIGIAPLVVEGSTAQLVGHKDVCDYLDFIVARGEEAPFFSSIIALLREQGITQLNLGPLHVNSKACRYLPKIAENLNCDIRLYQEDVLFEMTLPDSWDAYLKSISGKYRHEIRRKLRKLENAGRFEYRIVENSQDLENGINIFLSLFRSNRTDKSEFMTDQMVSFFNVLASSFLRIGMLKLYILEINGKPVGAVMCFDYRSEMYLYNNGYDDRFSWLSVGFISKLFSIRDSIQRRKKTYNFLKGSETYKKRLGGQEIPIYRCRIGL